MDIQLQHLHEEHVGLYSLKLHRRTTSVVIYIDYKNKEVDEELVFHFLLGDKRDEYYPLNKYYIVRLTSENTLEKFEIKLTELGKIAIPIPVIESAEQLYIEINGLTNSTEMSMLANQNTFFSQGF